MNRVPHRVDGLPRWIRGGLLRGPGQGVTVGVPIRADGRLWGVLAVSDPASMPAGAERRLSNFAELGAAVISAAHARHEANRLADEQRALRRVAELVARGASDQELFDAVANEASAVIDNEPTNLSRFVGPRRYTVVATCGGPAPIGLTIDVPVDDPGTVGQLLATGRPARRDDYRVKTAPLFAGREYGPGSSVSVPIVVDGQLWGMLGTLTEGRRLPSGTAQRLQKFAELIAAALANNQARAGIDQLAGEQAALLRVAALVAAGASEAQLFDAVATEATALIDGGPATLARFDGGRTLTIVSTCGGPAPVGTVYDVPIGDQGTTAEVLSTRRPARLDDYGTRSGPLFSQQAFGVGSSVAVPIIVDDQLWGTLGVLNGGQRLPTGTEDRLQKFGDLISAALANSQARKEIQQLSDRHAALLRVAELVAVGAPLPDVFEAVTNEASRLLDDLATALMRYDADDSATVVASCRSPAHVGLRIPLDADTDIGRSFLSGDVFRVPSFEGTNLADIAHELNVASGLAVPVIVEGRIWGALTTSTDVAPLPQGLEERLEEFSALASAAIANAENKDKLTASRKRIVSAADDGRRRLQRDVHDGVQQWLVQTVLTLQLGRETARRGDSALELIDEALRYAVRANSEMRDLVHGILPASLSRGGLRAGLESLIADIKIPVRLLFRRAATRRRHRGHGVLRDRRSAHQRLQTRSGEQR